ncbi:MAG TPA: ATP-binding cassette domain-containing protein [Bacteroidia bacterium]|nr:ATP-binding cassette domain-containing protein [Bacteroidia bacterium]HNU34722.1 ATP-binding cassette domain-containing protein [Bacteroidia bacterium]
MSDKILNALMQLFAILANAERFTQEGRSIVEAFLQQQISNTYIQKYLQIFDEHLATLQGKNTEGKAKKRVSVNSVKILRICTDINKELDTKQKHIVLIRLIEFVYSSDSEISEQEQEFLTTVAEVFHISKEEFDLCVSFVISKDEHSLSDSPQFLIISSKAHVAASERKYLQHESLHGNLYILNLYAAGILFVRYAGNDKLTLNGLPVLNNAAYVFSSGSVIRGSRIAPVYYSDVIKSYRLNDVAEDIVMQATELEYVFSNGKKGLNKISFAATSGNLIGVMGGSGAGKSTLFSILNGNNTPSAGSVTINGIDIHKHKNKLEGIIGFVPQDDLLMEDLSVRQNLFYNSKLCFGNLDDAQINAKVDVMLDLVGLSEAQHLKVGDALNNTISGGQRKRLNIALELIRAPQVLFVDEPTSGLSSLDSENVMDLLKQLAISGKLVFVVIHQPSSDIFKMFDKLLMLDKGGYPVYYGNPSDSLIYFKKKARFADADESECGYCGNINPEQVFSILESKVMDEFGQPTNLRKLSPQDWNNFYNEEFKNRSETLNPNANNTLVSIFRKPNWLKQAKVFIARDVLSKLRNTQYMLINFLEAPVLAFVLAFFLKYYNNSGDYVFRENKNLVAYIFMAVVVAIFMGLTVSAEEIIRDRKILKREKFLNLSRSSYLFSKIAIMFVISAIQTFSFVIIGNSIFGINAMYFDYWLILFSASCFSNLLGLNISASFNSVVTIYILIPFLVIPQIILSGVIVKFEDLNPTVTSQKQVPVIGEMITSRWAFEALAVNQFENNLYNKNFFEYDKQMSRATYLKDFWLQKINDKLDNVYSKKKPQLVAADIELLKHELSNMDAPRNENRIDINLLENLNETNYQKIKAALEQYKKAKINSYNKTNAEKDKTVSRLINTGGADALKKLKDDNTNESLDNIVLNKTDFTILTEAENSLVQRYQPVYMNGEKNSFLRAPLYVSQKNVFGNYHSTFAVNLAVIWLMTLSLVVALYFDWLNKALKFFERLFERKRE